MVDTEGGCLCGKVRYRVSAEPVFAGVCHCKNCQKGNGSAFSVVLAIPSAGLTVTGTLKEYVGRGDSGNATTKKFCPECGSPIAIEAGGTVGVCFLQVDVSRGQNIRTGPDSD
jgi:hypothetical protein